jgi:hypothetical protein
VLQPDDSAHRHSSEALRIEERVLDGELGVPED